LLHLNCNFGFSKISFDEKLFIIIIVIIFMVTILGIESTAHTFGVGIVRDGKILANEREMYTTDEGGIIPVDSANHHRKLAPEIYSRALESAGINEEDIDAVSFSQGPGLSPCLLAGRDFSRDLAIRLGKPLVPVNHCVAHLEVGKITGARDPVLLYCSGANTQVIAYASGKYRVFGETLDIGIGNFIDNFARYTGLGFPGGPKIEKIARKSTKFVDLPYSVKGMDIALSGILTNLRQKLEKGFELKDLAHSMQETVFAMLIETAERALAHVGKNELLLGGGVACNSRLQEMTRIMCDERGVNFFVPEKSLLVDNGAMIAYLGEIMFNAGVKVEGELIKEIDILPRQRTDDVEVVWKK
jgi:N6-L-threonylcarbamoyladenine synthase